jgi:EmrB/QacA subfamily drug resistance transporter
LLLGGRLGDLFGRTRVFLGGMVLFTLSSLACGLAASEAELVLARAAQGLGAALVSAVSLSLIVNLFHEPVPRARAMAAYAVVCAAGGGVGEVCGGLLTHTLGWHWVFLVNVPLGLFICGVSVGLLPRDASPPRAAGFDLLGAVSFTTAMALMLYSLGSIDDLQAKAGSALSLVVLSAMAFALYLVSARNAGHPLIPAELLRMGDFRVANMVAFLWAAGNLGCFVIATLYLQRVLEFDPFQTGLAFVPSEIAMAVFAAGLSARVVARFGVRRPVWVGLLLAAAGVVLFTRAPVSGRFLIDVLPGTLLLGSGAGLASAPLFVAAMQDVDPRRSGVASGVLNTSFMMGGASGVALLSGIAAARNDYLRHWGLAAVVAQNGGYHLAFLTGAVLIAAAATLSAVLFRRPTPLRSGRRIAEAY